MGQLVGLFLNEYIYEHVYIIIKHLYYILDQLHGDIFIAEKRKYSLPIFFTFTDKPRKAIN